MFLAFSSLSPVIYASIVLWRAIGRWERSSRSGDWDAILNAKWAPTSEAFFAVKATSSAHKFQSPHRIGSRRFTLSFFLNYLMGAWKFSDATARCGFPTELFLCIMVSFRITTQNSNLNHKLIGHLTFHFVSSSSGWNHLNVAWKKMQKEITRMFQQFQEIF